MSFYEVTFYFSLCAVLPTFGVEIAGPRYILPDEDTRVNIFVTARFVGQFSP